MNNAEFSLTPTEDVLVPACVENFEMHDVGEVLCGTTHLPPKSL